MIEHPVPALQVDCYTPIGAASWQGGRRKDGDPLPLYVMRLVRWVRAQAQLRGTLLHPTVTLVRNDPVNTARRTLIEESMGCEDDQATLQGA
jgi:hypothetical protein